MRLITANDIEDDDEPLNRSPTRRYALPPRRDDRCHGKSPDDHRAVDLFAQNPVSREDCKERQEQLHLTHRLIFAIPPSARPL